MYVQCTFCGIRLQLIFVFATLIGTAVLLVGTYASSGMCAVCAMRLTHVVCDSAVGTAYSESFDINSCHHTSRNANT